MSINVSISISKFEQDRSIEKKNRREVGDLSIHDWDEAGHVVKNKHPKFEQDRSIEKNTKFEQDQSIEKKNIFFFQCSYLVQIWYAYSSQHSRLRPNHG